ncbi:MAG: hypothetical protein ABH864_03350 [archaeon]
MALNVSLLDLPWPVYLSALILVVAAIIVLTAVEMRLGKRAKAKKEYEETYYQKKLSAVMALKSDPNAFLISLDKVAREFFSEALGLQSMARYSELVDKLGKAQKVESAKFCSDMQEALYSGEVIDQAILFSLYERLKSFVLRKDRNDAQNKKQVEEIMNVQSAESAVNEMPLNQNILKYVAEGKRRGFEAGALKEKLLSAGFDEHEVERVLAHLARKDSVVTEKPRMSINTEKRILTSFFNPKNKDLEVIKKGIEEKDELGRAEIIEIVPYEREVPRKKKAVEYPKEEPESYRQIGSLDNLDRVKEKIKSRRQGIVSG